MPEYLVETLPVKLLPKTSSSEGINGLGVVVFITDSFDGSMPGNLDIASSSD